MAFSNPPYQPPAHIVQLSIQHIDICATPHSYPVPKTKSSYVVPTAMYSQSTPPKDGAVREKHIQKRFMNNLIQYQETSMTQPVKEEVLEAPIAKQFNEDDPYLQLHKTELNRHRENSSTIKAHCTRGEEYEGRSHKGKEWKKHSKTNASSMRSQKRRSGEKGSVHRKRGKERGNKDHGDE